MAIVESGPISIKVDMGMAMQILKADPEFRSRLEALLKEYALAKFGETANGKRAP